MIPPRARACALLVLTLLAGLAAPRAAAAVEHHRDDAGRPVGVAALLGDDVSWPQCPHGQPLPHPGAFVIIGLTNGTALHPNPCLDEQLAWGARSRRPLAAYTMVNPPTRDELRRDQKGPLHPCTGRGSKRLLCAFGNAGASEALFALRTLAARGWRTGLVWADVEVRTTQPWHSGQKPANRALLAGFDATLRAAGVRAGYYSSAYQWRLITGGWKPPADSPEWYAIGAGGLPALRAACRRSFAGGPTAITQSVWGNHDKDFACPAGQPVVTAMSLHLPDTAAMDVAAPRSRRPSGSWSARAV